MKKLIVLLATLFVAPNVIAHDLSKVVQKAIHSVAYIEVENYISDTVVDPVTGTVKRRNLRAPPIIGSGFVIEGNIVVTNFHVVEFAIQNKTEVYVSFYEDETKFYHATILGYDQVTDVALLKINSVRPSVEINLNFVIEPGKDVFSISNFYGIHFSVTKGIVSSHNRKNNRYPYIHHVQLQLLEGSGSSGGAVFNDQGQVVAMTQSILSMTSSISNPNQKMLSSVVFAIRSDILVNSIERIKREGVVVRPDLGVMLGKYDHTSIYYQEANKEDQEYTGMVVLYSDYTDNEFQYGDILVSIEGLKFLSPDMFLIWLDNNYSVGDNIKVLVYREGKLINITVPILVAKG